MRMDCYTQLHMDNQPPTELQQDQAQIVIDQLRRNGLRAGAELAGRTLLPVGVGIATYGGMELIKNAFGITIPQPANTLVDIGVSAAATTVSARVACRNLYRNLRTIMSR